MHIINGSKALSLGMVCYTAVVTGMPCWDFECPSEMGKRCRRMVTKWLMAAVSRADYRRTQEKQRDTQWGRVGVGSSRTGEWGLRPCCQQESVIEGRI